MDYNPNTYYRFTDAEGNTIEAVGDNGYVAESVQTGIPISVGSNGEWFTTPYLEKSGGQVVAHLPEWFKSTPEYQQWQQYTPYITNNLTSENLSNLSDILSSLGRQSKAKTAVSKEALSYGVTNNNLQNQYYNNLAAIANEDKDNKNAISIYGKDFSSIADAARHYRDLGKEELSARLTAAQEVLDRAKEGKYTSEQDQAFTVDTLTLTNLLTAVNNNPTRYGEEGEFNGLLEASLWQKIQTFIGSSMQSLTEQSVFGLLARGAYGVGEVIQGRPLSLEIEAGREQLLNRPSFGGGLSGRDFAAQAGNVFGSLENIAVTWTLSSALGEATQGRTAAMNPNSFLNKVSSKMGKVGGSLATNFFLNDVPIDATFAITKAARGENWLIDTERTQPLIKTPLSLAGAFGVDIQLGPQVPDGMFFDLVGDAIVDLAPVVIPTVGGAAFQKLDDLTNGAVSRVREKIAVGNLKVQSKVGEIPVVGKAWTKFMNSAMNPA